ncbi:MAG: hypothetical protein Q9224_005214 [Gallowayella concinna]
MAYLNTTAVALSTATTADDPLAEFIRTVPYSPTPPRETKPSLFQRIKNKFTIRRLKTKQKSLPRQFRLPRVPEEEHEVFDPNPDSRALEFIYQDRRPGFESHRDGNLRVDGNDSYHAEEVFRRGQRVWLRDNQLPPPAYHEIGEEVPGYVPPAATNRRNHVGEYAFLRREDSPEYTFIDL